MHYVKPYCIVQADVSSQRHNHTSPYHSGVLGSSSCDFFIVFPMDARASSLTFILSLSTQIVPVLSNHFLVQSVSLKACMPTSVSSSM